MFRSLFGTTVAGDGGSTGGAPGGNAGKPPGQKQAARKAPSNNSTGPSSSSSKAGGGGFFQLEPTTASAGAEDSLFDDLEVKPPAKEAKSAPMNAPPDAESAGGVFSAFQFMATPASGTEEAAAPPPAVDASPSSTVPAPAETDAAAVMGGGGEAGGGGGGGAMSAFSFLTADEPRAQNAAASPSGGGGHEGQGQAGPAESSMSTTATPSSFTFLSEGMGAGGGATAVGDAGDSGTQVSLASSPLAAAASGSGNKDAAPLSSSTSTSYYGASSDGVADAAAAAAAGSGGHDHQFGAGRDGHSWASGGGGGGGGSSGRRSPSMTSAASSPSSSSRGGAATGGGSAVSGTATSGIPAGEGGAQQPGTAVPAWKPSTGVVRKKRTARRVGYARDETLSSPTAAQAGSVGSGAGSPATAGSAEKGGGSGTIGDPNSSGGGGGGGRGGLPPVVAATGGGISYVSEAAGGQYEAPSVPLSGSRKAGERGAAMDDSMVAEAAAMAALAASMAPGDIQGSMTKGDVKQGSSHGTASSTTSSATGGGSAGLSGAAGGGATSLQKFKGLLSHSSSKSESSPTTASASRSPRTFPKESSIKAAEVPAQAGGAGDRDAAPPARSSTLPAVPAGEHKWEEGKAVQEMRQELQLLINAFQGKSKSLSDRLTEAASEKAALACTRASVGNAHAEGIRRLAEAEAEQQRLADEEEFEKAAELSVEIESLREDSESAARRLRELEEDEAFLDGSSSEARAELLGAVEDAARGFKDFQGRQDAKLGRLVSERAALFEEENRRMNTEQERLALEKTHVERDWVHLEEELAQTEGAISVQTGGEDERMSKLRLQRMELEGEVRELEAQLDAKKASLEEVVVGLDEAEGRITAVRAKFERQLQRLRERERLVEVSRQDCQKEEALLQSDRDRHREQMEKATQEQQCLQEAVEGVAEDVKLAEILQTTLAVHWMSESRPGGAEGDSDGIVDEPDDNDAGDDALKALRSEVEGARSRYELKARAVAALEEQREELRAETTINANALPGLEQKKRAAVAAKDYKEAGHVSRQIKETERRQQEVSEMLSDLDQSLAEGSPARQELEATRAGLTQAEEARRVAEEAVAVSRIASLERRAKPIRRASRAVGRRSKPGGLRETAESLLALQLASLDAEAKDISARHGLAPPELSQPQPGDSDPDSDQSRSDAGDSATVGDEDSAGDGGGGDDAADQAEASGLEEVAEAADDERPEGDGVSPPRGVPSAEDEGGPPPPEDAPGVQQTAWDTEALAASRELIEMECAEVQRDLAELDVRLAAALVEEDYDQAAELDSQMNEVRTRLADFASQAAALTRPGSTSATVMSGAAQSPDDVGGGGRGDGSSLDKSPTLPSSSVTEGPVRDQAERSREDRDADAHVGEDDRGGDGDAVDAAAAEEEDEDEVGAVEVAQVNDAGETDCEQSGGDVCAGPSADNDAGAVVEAETLTGAPEGREIAEDANDAPALEGLGDGLETGSTEVVEESTGVTDFAAVRGVEQEDK